MKETVVSRWFGPQFSQLHPLLQALHREGGVLQGQIDIRTGRGLAGFFGRRLARSLGIPIDQRQRSLRVEISHSVQGLNWVRHFDNGAVMRSHFMPVGVWPTGHWLEHTGPVRLRLTVDVLDGGWQWRVLGVRLRGLPLPLWLFPHSVAGKRIEQGRYVFYVGFRLPLLGLVLSYGGALVAQRAEASKPSAIAGQTA